MTLISRANQILREEGIFSLLQNGSRYVSRQIIWSIERRSYDFRYPRQYVFDDDWDTLIILDACRYDLWTEVQNEFDFLKSVEHQSIHSPASSSREWMEKTFTDTYSEEMSETAYVTANPFTRDHADESDFAILDEVWKYGWDTDLGVVPPDVVTDRAIDVARSRDSERLLVHYMQPHFPSLRNPEFGSKIDPDTNNWINSVWERLEKGEVDRDMAWKVYHENLQAVLEDVEILLTNHEASKVVITADHGNGFGEKNIYGHPGDRAHRVLREVPYCITDAKDTRSYLPGEEYRSQEQQITDDDVQERLQSLGYMSE